MYAAILDQLVIGLFALNREKEVIYWNRWMERSSGVSATDIQGITLDSLKEPISERFRAAVDDALHHGRSTLLSHSLHRTPLPLYASEYQREQGERIQQQVYVLPVVSDSGDRFCAIQVLDVTVANQREKLLRESDRRLRSLINALPDFICFKDECGRWLETNRAAAELLNLDVESFRGKTTTELFGTTPDILSQLKAQNDSQFCDGSAHHVTRKHVVDQEGKRRIFEVNRLAIDGQGDVVIGRDVTGYKEMEQQLRELNQTLEQRVREEMNKRLKQQRLLVQSSKMAAMGEMIQAITHQWKQPLNIISFLMQNLRDISRHQKFTPEAMEDAIEKTLQQIDFMAGTVEDFKDFFHPDKTKSAFDLREAIRQVENLLSQQFKLQQIEVKHHQVSDRQPMPPLIGYPNEFKQVILNLLNNAKDAIEAKRKHEGHQPGTIEVTVEFHQPDRFHVTIADNAGGIPAEAMEKLFTPYFTTKEDGTGIGLSLCRTIIEDHFAGSIEARNTSTGAQFIIELRNP